MTSQLHQFRHEIASTCTACRGVVVSIAALLAMSIFGCARSDQAPDPRVTTTPDAQATKTSASTSVEKRNDAASKPVASTFDASKHAPEDIFEVTEAAPDFEIVGRSVSIGVPDAETFIAEPPAAAVETATFVVSGDKSASKSSQSVAIALPPGFAAIPNVETISGMPSRIRCNIDGSELALIPAGAAWLGSNSGAANAQPAIETNTDTFYVGITEVRVGQYAEAKKRVAAKGTLLGEAMNAGSAPELPVLGVQWIDAKNYAVSVGCELPTEAQWEKAARGPGGYSSPWGNSRPLWTEPRTPDQIDVVGRHEEDRSVYGVYDMAGNAWEWVADLYHEEAFKPLAQIPFERRKNWTGPRTSSGTSLRVVKGGGENWCVYARRGIRMTDKNPQIGFRLVLNLAAK